MAASAVTTVQTVGWSLTGLGIAVSLGWNCFNQYRTGAIAKKLRAEQYRNAQWTRIRASIEKSIDGLVDAGFVVLKQAQSADPTKPDSVSIDTLNLTLVQAQDRLASALAEADHSGYCDGTEWSSAANGVRAGSESSWDIVLASFAEAQATEDKALQIAALAKISTPISQIRDVVAQRCRIQDIELDPEKI